MNSGVNPNRTNRPFLHLHFDGQVTKVNGDTGATLGAKVASDSCPNGDGVFLDWHWDGQQLTVRNDRYGMYPLFYACFANQFILSPSILPLLESEVSKELDYSALAVLFRIGHMIGNDTPFEHIKLLPPNSKLTWQAGKLHLESASITSCFRQDTQLSYDEAVDGYIHYFRKAIARRLPTDGKCILPISGGRDSRNILFELHQQGILPERAVTLRYSPPSTNEDERVAKIICQRLGIHHDIVEKPANWFDSELEDIYQTDFCGGGHPWVLPLRDYMRKQSVQTLFDGLAGDVISAGHRQDKEKDSLYRSGNLQQLATNILSAENFEQFNRSALSTEFFQKIQFERARERLVTELAKHGDCGNPLMSFTFWNRTRRAIGTIPYSIMADVDTIHCPFLDADFFDFCTGINADIILTGKFHDDVIARAYPALADIPFEDKSLKAQADLNSYLYYSRSVAKLAEYLMKDQGNRCSKVRHGYLISKMLTSFIKGGGEPPWYLRRVLYLSELERVCAGGVERRF